MANEDIRRSAKLAGVRLWEIAEKLGLHDSGFSRMLRRELSDKDRDKALQIIAELSERKLKGECRMNIPDHPVIRNMETTGTPDGKAEQYPRCPACGEECETVFRDRFGAYIGCDVCVETKDAWEVQECFPEKE